MSYLNKPVAWIIKHEGDYGFGNVSCSKQELQDEIDECSKNVPHWNHGTVIPLYTHPVKELTDEEIANIWEECGDSDIAKDMQVKSFIKYFAKAILRKAQEK